MKRKIEINKKGHLTIGGADTITLAQKYQTPLLVMDEEKIRSQCRKYVQALKRHYQGNGRICYASKAFCCKEIYRIIKEEGLGADAVSAGEIFTALRAGFDLDKIFFHGNNKTEEELAFALQEGVGRIVADNMEELQLLSRLAQQYGRDVNVLLRIKPGIDAHTHRSIRTGQNDSKFGFSYETGEAIQAACYVAQAKGLKLIGAHCHIGSQIVEIEPYALAAQKMMAFLQDVFNKTGIAMRELNLGGGFGIAYGPDDVFPSPDDYLKAIAPVVQKWARQYQMDAPFLILEPGRSIVGEAGITLYTVGSRKEIPGVCTYISVDGGMTDNPRYALYGAQYEVLHAKYPMQGDKQVVTIAGKCCESGDIIARDVPLGYAKAGDVIAVMDTGAYNYSMASHYNRIANPAVVMVKDGIERVIVRRETLEDLIRNDV